MGDGLKRVAKQCGGMTTIARDGTVRRFDADGDLIIECSKGGMCKWRIDGMHSNVFCGKCFKSYPKGGEA